jgi:hypothetical protein
MPQRKRLPSRADLIVILCFCTLSALCITVIGYEVAIRVVGEEPRSLEDYGGAFGAIDSVLGGLASLLIVITLFLQWREMSDRIEQSEGQVGQLEKELAAQAAIGNALALNALVSSCQAKNLRTQTNIAAANSTIERHRKLWMEARSVKQFPDAPVDDEERTLRGLREKLMQTQTELLQQEEVLEQQLMILYKKLSSTVVKPNQGEGQ